MSDFVIPKILQCHHFKLHSDVKNTRMVKDYEFDFYLNGQRDMYIDGKYYPISKGMLVFRKPGQLVESYGDYDMYALTVDFSLIIDIPQHKYIRNREHPQQALCHHDVFDSVPEAFYPYHQDEIKSIMKKMINCSYPNMVDISMQQKLVGEFLFLVLHDSFKNNREAKYTATNINYVEQACKYINKHYAEDIKLDDIAVHLSINKHYLIRLFKKELSVTPNQYILETRLFYSRLMLIQTDFSIENISASCGFNTPSYFIKCFKEKVGKSPGVYRREFLK